MGDFVKIGVKVALVATICVAIYQIFASISISLPALTTLIALVAKAKAIVFFYMPWVQTYFTLIMALCQAAIAVWTFYFAMLSVRFIMKVNE